MVKGLDTFRKYFEEYEVLLGIYPLKVGNWNSGKWC